jgi:hydroxyacylglutathione hydrolase
MLLRTIYDEKLAQASYLLGCQKTGEAIVVDPNRDVDQYIRLAQKEGLRITHVTETHIHADFVSGTRELAHRTKAVMYLSGEGGADWSYGFAELDGAVVLHDGDTFDVGNLRIDVMHTPGHTPEHIVFLVTDTPVTDQPMGLFTGDFVFVGDVGRPDLLEKAAGVANTMRAGAASLFQSIQRFRELPDYLQVWPGHGAGSACGKALGAVPQSTVGYEKMFSAAFQFDNEEDFTDFILVGQPEPPKYFAHMKHINRDGPPVLGELRPPDKLADEILANMMENEATIVDVRNQLVFARAHVPGTINVPYNGAFTGRAGAIIPYDRPFALIIDERTAASSLNAIARDLAIIGLDQVSGYFAESVVTGDTQSIGTVATSDVEKMLDRDDVQVVDVRNRSEWDAGHLPGVPNVPLNELTDRVNELPRDKRIIVHCESGGRSAVAASVLQAAGYNVGNFVGGYTDWVKSGKPVEKPESPAPGAPSI